MFVYEENVFGRPAVRRVVSFGLCREMGKGRGNGSGFNCDKVVLPQPRYHPFPSFGAFGSCDRWVYNANYDQLSPR